MIKSLTVRDGTFVSQNILNRFATKSENFIRLTVDDFVMKRQF